MKKMFQFVFLILILLNSLAVLAGGDDVGNGGFAFQQSQVILQKASQALTEKISNSDMQIGNCPDCKSLLLNVVNYSKLKLYPLKTKMRAGKELAFDYSVYPTSIDIYRPFFLAFMGRADSELEEASLEVQKRLLHEASHLWGYNEIEAENFAKSFLAEYEKSETRTLDDILLQEDYCICKDGISESGEICKDQCLNYSDTANNSILFVNSVLGNQVLDTSNVRSLYDWCNARLRSNTPNHLCYISLVEDNSEIALLPIKISKNSNMFSANVSLLKYNREYFVRFVDKSTSNIQSRNLKIIKQSPTYK